MNPAGSPPRTFDAAQVSAFLRFLLPDPSLACVELRLWSARFNFKTNFIEPATLSAGNVLSGWYDRPDTLIADAQRLLGVSAYVTSNPVSRDLLSLSYNQLARVKTNTTDNDIVRLSNLFLDIDARRKTGISSTAAELAAALGRRDAILGDFPELQAASVWGCSGNGGLILARTPGYPNEAEGRALWARVVDGFVARYSDNVVEVGPQSKNPARVMPLPGTVKCKGSHRPERPHRLVTLAEECRGRLAGPVAGLAEPAAGAAGWLQDGLVPVDLREIAGRLPDPAAAGGQSGRPTTVQMPGEHAGNTANGSGNGTANGTADGSGNGQASQTGGRQAGQARGRQAGKPVPPPEGVYDPAWAAYRCQKMIFGPKFRESVAGLKGHDALFHAAAVIWSGFGLTDDVGFRLFEEWNQSAKPPEDEYQVKHKWESVAKKKGTPTLKEYWEARKEDGIRNGQNGRNAVLGDDGPGPDPDAPTDASIIVVSTRRNEVVDLAVEAMGGLQEVYQRANELVRVLRDSVPSKKLIRPPGSPRISLMPKARLHELMSIAAAWKSFTESGKLRDSHPPAWVIDAVMARGEWPKIRHLEAIIETPIVRHDGSILDRPGWDSETTLLYEPEILFTDMVADQPSHDEARMAADELLDVVSQFPFVNETHSAAWLAGLLTPLARFAIDGPCPLFLFDANSPGSGKSLLCDIISVIATGRPMPRTAYPDNDEEMRKRITSIALAGDRLMMLDNIAATFGGSSLDGMLTGRTWKDRILGHSEMSPDLPLFTVWYGTGNNITFRGDVLRRVIHCRLEARQERPEERTEFKHERILQWVTAERRRLLSACLTILSAYLKAGKPDRLPPLGSFEVWSDVVRSAVAWAIGHDPCGTRKELTATDAETNIRIAVIEGWQQIDWDGAGKTASQVLQMLKENPNGYPTLYSGIMEISHNDHLPSPKSLSKLLSRIKGRVVNRKALKAVPYQGTLIWKVIPVESEQESTESESEEIRSRGIVGSVGLPNQLRAQPLMDRCPEEGDLSHEARESHETHNPTEPDSDPAEGNGDVPF
jgi:hypothetical protein